MLIEGEGSLKGRKEGNKHSFILPSGLLQYSPSNKVNWKSDGKKFTDVIILVIEPRNLYLFTNTVNDSNTSFEKD